MESLLQHLIPDLANLVLEYCWTVTIHSWKACLYGNYEKLSSYECEYVRRLPFYYGGAFISACMGGHIKIVQYLLTNCKIPGGGGMDNISGLTYACLEGHKDVVQLLLPYFEEIPHTAFISKRDHTEIVNLMKPYRA